MSSEPFDTYIAGQYVTFRVTFTQEVLPPTNPPSYAAYDPTPANSITFEAEYQDGTTVIAKINTVDSEVTREGTGAYRCIVPLPRAGWWYAGFKSADGNIGRCKVLIIPRHIP